MKRFLILVGVLLFAGVEYGAAQAEDVNWTEDQLKAPAELAEELNSEEEETPFIFDIGPSGHILGSVHIGPAEFDENLQRLKQHLEDLPRDKEVVIYCGCCPFEHCPNVRPAFQLLLDEGFQKPRLLNLSQNLKADWIDKGYPLEEEK